jgi:hypothetical protein
MAHALLQSRGNEPRGDAEKHDELAVFQMHHCQLPSSGRLLDARSGRHH